MNQMFLFKRVMIIRIIGFEPGNRCTYSFMSFVGDKVYTLSNNSTSSLKSEDFIMLPHLEDLIMEMGL